MQIFANAAGGNRQIQRQPLLEIQAGSQSTFINPLVISRNDKNMQLTLFRPKTNHTCHQKPNPSRETVPFFNLKFVMKSLNWCKKKTRENFSELLLIDSLAIMYLLIIKSNMAGFFKNILRFSIIKIGSRSETLNFYPTYTDPYIHADRICDTILNTVTKGLQLTKRWRHSWLTNSALVCEPKCGVEGGVAGSQPMCTAVHITWHGAQINFGDLPPYLTYCYNPLRCVYAVHH